MPCFLAKGQAGRRAYEVCNAHSELSAFERTSKARLSQEPDGTIRAHFASADDQKAVLDGIAPTETDVEDGVAGSAELSQITGSASEVDWVNVKLQDPEVKLAVRTCVPLTHVRV